MSKVSNSKYISVKGAKTHNLKNVSIDIPRNKFVVVTGVSGSGKSSFAFDTLYAEGQRRYIESLSSYARQFLGKIKKPEVDVIKGIPPAIAIEQKVNTRNPRSTVGTSTEVYDYLKLLYARIGVTYSPVSGNIVKRHTTGDVIDYLLKLDEGTRFVILSAFQVKKERSFNQELELLQQQGFSRIELDGHIVRIKEAMTLEKEYKKFNLVIDRLAVSHSEDFMSRTADSIETAFFEGNNRCSVKVFIGDETKEKKFSKKFEADGLTFEEPTQDMFSFNNPVGACPKCEGYGKIIGVNEDLVVPNKYLSVYEGAVVCWRGEKMIEWKNDFIIKAAKYDFPIHKPYYELSDKEMDILWSGAKGVYGIYDFFDHLDEKKYKIQFRVLAARYKGKTRCPECKGRRLKKEAQYVKVGERSITELVDIPILKLKEFFDELKLSKHDSEVAKRILREINIRISFLINVGLGYLTLNRLSSTLSGGESQRINLATSLGSSLVGSLYILDEPSIGLHSRDTDKLIGVLKNLKSIGNTVVVVEHDEDIIRSAEEIIDIGPAAGVHGGEIVFQGDFDALDKSETLTSKYLRGVEKIEIPTFRRPWNSYVEIKGAVLNNLKGVSVKFPMGILTAVTGVSGSGKSTLVNEVLHNRLHKYYDSDGIDFDKSQIDGDLKMYDHVELINQSPIGKSSRSNPATYMKAYDEIRKLFSEQQASKINGFKPSHFSFNVAGGRCEECEGEGTVKVEMQFMADITMVCEHCNGKRFKDDILEVKYSGKSIYEVLELSVNQAIDFFSEKKGTLEKKIVKKLQPLLDVGLGYIKIGQSSSTLSGGESQRIKLAFFLSKENKAKPGIFIFDEPTTGLHFNDTKVLMKALNALVDKGNTAIVIEHNLDVVKSADWVIDLGPEGGDKGGNVVFEGVPEDIIKCEGSYTGQYLTEKMS